MSDMEHNKGKLIPFTLTEEVAKGLVQSKNEHLDDFYENYVEQVSDDPSWYDESLTRVNDKWYKVEFEIERGDLYGFAKAKENEDGSINFDTYHYTGGAHWTEVVEDVLNNE